jgi:hypothetical protein
VPAALILLVYGALGGFSLTPEGISSYYRVRGARIAVLPWTAVFVVALGLEIAGLALGGHSKDVPTLSTVLDHLLAAHGGRWLLYLWWLWVGVRTIAPLVGRQQPKETS